MNYPNQPLMPAMQLGNQQPLYTPNLPEESEIAKNAVVQLTITALNSEGNGIGRVKQFVVFVPFAAVGDVLLVKLLKITKTYAYGKIVEILSPSADRTTPDCAVFGKCGGCDYRHLTYEAELAAKDTVIQDAFTRIGKLSPEFLPIIPNGNIDRYRNKAQYPIQKDSDGQMQYGFYRAHSHDVVPCKDCPLQPKIFHIIMEKLMKLLQEKKISVYDEQKHEGVLRHICLRRGHVSEEVAVTLVVRRKVPAFSAIAAELGQCFPAIQSITLSVNREKTNAIYDYASPDIVLYGKAFITDQMCGNTIALYPKAFYQVNTPMAERLYAEMQKLTDVQGKIILDLYSGIGTIAMSVARQAQQVYAVEIIEDAVKAANLNFAKNELTNVTAVAGDVKDVLQSFAQKQMQPDIILLDPARKGCSPGVLESVIGLAPSEIVMISCNPATAARDCQILRQGGYKVRSVQGVDLFSRTRHVECVVLMSRVKD